MLGFDQTGRCSTPTGQHCILEQPNAPIQEVTAALVKYDAVLQLKISIGSSCINNLKILLTADCIKRRFLKNMRYITHFYAYEVKC